MKRLMLTLVVAVCLVAALAGAAAAIEDAPADGGPTPHQMPGFDEVGSGSEISQGFRPSEYETPAFFRFILYPLLGVGLLATLLLLFAYLLWQPRFVAEGKTKRRR